MNILPMPQALISQRGSVKKNDAIKSALDKLNKISWGVTSSTADYRAAQQDLCFYDTGNKVDSNEAFRVFDEYFDVRRNESNLMETFINNGIDCAVMLIEDVNQHNSSLSDIELDTLIKGIHHAIFIGVDYLQESENKEEI
ncbi:hypothetical protein ACU8XX_22200 [Escherichia sp. MAL-1]